jgi:hypothetical protein
MTSAALQPLCPTSKTSITSAYRALKVRGKPFGEWKGVGPTAVFAASQEEAAAAVAEDHSVYEPVCRTASTKVFVGVP